MNTKFKIIIPIVAFVLIVSGCTTSGDKPEGNVVQETTVTDKSEIPQEIVDDLKVDVSELTELDYKLLENINDIDIRDFTLPDFDGDEHSLSDYKGQVVILNFWAVGCPPCVKELPEFDEVAKKDGVVLVTVAQKDVLGNSKKKSGEFIEDFDTVALWDENGDTMNVYPSQYYPHTYIIDRQGVIRFVINSADYDFLNKLVTFCDEKLN